MSDAFWAIVIGVGAWLIAMVALTFLVRFFNRNIP